MGNAKLLQIRAKLAERGQNLATWARARGYKPDTVRRTVRRWSRPRSGIPHGSTTLQIINDLAADTGVRIAQPERAN